MAEAVAKRLMVGVGAAQREIAVLKRDGAAPGLFWLGGYRSDMGGTKAAALDAFAAEEGLAAVRFDYSGHGASGGRFEDGTISRWLEEARAVFDRFTEGPQIVVGSSMGGWIALHLAVALRDTARIAGLVLIAPAVDMTRALMWDRWKKKARDTLMRDGVYREPNPYSAESYFITRALIEDGDQHLFGETLIEVGCPVTILQGGADAEVPWRHASALLSRLASDDVVFTLIKDGDHRLSRPEDIERLRTAVATMIADARTATGAAA